MDNFFNSATTKLTADLNSESLAALRSESTDTDSHSIKRSKKKLKTIKELSSFAKEAGNMERTKSKMVSIEHIEDQLESHCDDA